jgi:hypothetical protein
VAEYTAPVDPREGLFAFSGFRGLRNNVPEDAFSSEDLSVALNIDVDDSLAIARRKGYSAPVTTSVDRDLWASGAVCLGVGSNALKLVNSDYSLVTLRSGLTASRALSYAPAGDRVFYANGAELGCVQNGASRTWGITPPALPLAAATAGTLLAGTYQYVVTYLRDDGQESGAGKAGTIELTATGGIALSAIPVSTDPSVVYKIIYATSVGGETLYRTGLIANADTTYVIRESRKGSSPLLTQFLAPPPAGDFIGYWNGHALVASGARLYPSEPYAPELFDLRKAVPFLDRIVMVAPVLDGVWIGTNTQVIWMAGDSPSMWKYNPRAEYGVIPGTLAYGDSEILGDGSVRGEVVAFFATTRGLCAGRVGGGFVNLTQDRYAYGTQDRGASIIRRHRGIAQFLTTLQGVETPGNVAA